jgi:K+-transporting ATPase ATPase C chain
MLSHLRANFFLLIGTLFLCCVVYPLILWGIGQTAFPDQAEGSLVKDQKGNTIGSRLIAQPFNGDGYFQPRPSAVGYNAAASGASNWGASNPKLRDRVARQLGPIVKYNSGVKKDQLVGPDIDAWLTAERVGAWAKAHPDAGSWWIDSDKDAIEKLLDKWQKDHGKQETAEKKDLVVPFFAFYAASGKEKRKDWPDEVKAAVRSVFFDTWLQENRGVELQQVPADMVMTSGSGLDPHITLKNAQYQLDRVAAARAKTPEDIVRVCKEIEAMLREKAEAPLGGLVGEPLINVLVVNQILDDHPEWKK